MSSVDLLTLSDVQIEGDVIHQMEDSFFMFSATVINSQSEGYDIPPSTNGEPVFQFKVFCSTNVEVHTVVLYGNSEDMAHV